VTDEDRALDLLRRLLVDDSTLHVHATTEPLSQGFAVSLDVRRLPVTRAEFNLCARVRGDIPGDTPEVDV
jgi:hypothetical protein